MPNPEGVRVSTPEKEEKKVALSSLGPGSVFRIPGVSYEDAIGGDDPCGHFYHVSSQKKDGLVTVMSFDWKERKLPEEILVHQHNINITIYPCQRA